jgi:hypothetical protein
MKANLLNLTYEVELKPGEKLTLPDSLVVGVGEGRWLITIQPVAGDDSPYLIPERIRDHSAFLNSYVAEDEGLYDDPTG